MAPLETDIELVAIVFAGSAPTPPPIQVREPPTAISSVGVIVVLS